MLHTRRRFLLKSAAGSCLALPLLQQRASAYIAPPRRFVAVCATLGFHGPYWFPKTTGHDYVVSPYLQPLAAHRDQLTVFSGLSHPDQQGNNGHASELTWLTSAMRPGLAGFRNSVSIDQLIASQVGGATRFPSLVLSTSRRSLSWTNSGVEIPGQDSPAKLFAQMFLAGTAQQQEQELQRIGRGQSILDTATGQATRLQRSLGQRDREKLDQYLTSVRELEVRMQQSANWLDRPKPTPGSEPPQDVSDRLDAIARQRLMYDMIVLALQTDSTRTVSFLLSGMNAVPKVSGVSSDWHNLSHHGKDPDKIAELRIIEQAELVVFAEFLDKLASINEDGGTLLDNTCVLFGSNLGNASAHDWRNLPILLAGGGFKHGQHIAYDMDNNTPLANLFVSIARHLGLPLERFGSSSSTISPISAG